MAEQNKKKLEKNEDAIALKGKDAGLIIYKSTNGVGIAIFNKKEKKIGELDLTREQWLTISGEVLKNCFTSEGK